jgi:hypothetical protein
MSLVACSEAKALSPPTTRQALSTQAREIVKADVAWNELRARQVDDGAGVDDESGHRRPQIGCRSAAGGR